MITNPEIIHRLSDAGIRPSLQRIAVMGYLMEHRTHPTVDEIYSDLSDSMPTLSKTTVYNTLKILTDSGVAQMLSIEEQNTRYDADVMPHSHLLCHKCGRVFDMPFFEFKNPITESPEGHRIEETYQFFRGVCSECRNK